MYLKTVILHGQKMKKLEKIVLLEESLQNYIGLL